MTGREFTRHTRAAERKALRAEPRLLRAYEETVRAAARRAATAYRKASRVTVAAGERPQPALDEVLNQRVLEESARARTRGPRRRMARAIQDAYTSDMLDPALEQLIEAQAGVQAARLVAGAQEQVQDVMRRALEDGWSVDTTAGAIQERLTEVAGWQARMLARTDLISLTNAASLVNAQVLGDDAPKLKVWVATADSRTREDHLDADGQTVGLDEPFDVGGELLLYPGDPQGSDGQTINCRCTVIYTDSELASREHSDLGGVVEVASAGSHNLGGAMPWEIEQVEDEFCVVRSDTGETVKCHGSQEQATAHLRALYANVEDATMAALETEQVNPGSLDEMLTAATVTAEQRRQWADEGIALPDGSYPIPDKEFLRKAIGALGRASQNDEYDRVKRHIIKRARALDALGMLPDDWAVTASAPDVDALLAAAALLEQPPAEWFEDPQLEEPTPLTVTDDGRVFGHIGHWDQCHTGYPDSCVRPPQGGTYEFFNTAIIETADGSQVKAGRITAGVGHASLTASKRDVIQHYDNTSLVAAFVRAGEDKHGPWVAGALSPHATAAQVTALKTNLPSGDWRQVRYQGRKQMELMGVLAVPVPGFPIPRAAVTASAAGEQEIVALIAGVEPEVEYDLSPEEIERRIRVLLARADGIDGLALLAQGDDMEEMDAEDPVEHRMHQMPVSSTKVEAGGVTITINVGEPEDEEIPLHVPEKLMREIGMQIDFLRDHGRWSATPLSGAQFTPEEFEQVLEYAPALVSDPDTATALLLQERMKRQGLLTSAAA